MKAHAQARAHAHEDTLTYTHNERENEKERHLQRDRQREVILAEDRRGERERRVERKWDKWRCISSSACTIHSRFVCLLLVSLHGLAVFASE